MLYRGGWLLAPFFRVLAMIPQCGLGGGTTVGPCSGTLFPSDAGKGLFFAAMAQPVVSALLAAGLIFAGVLFVSFAVRYVASFFGRSPVDKNRDADFGQDFIDGNYTGYVADDWQGDVYERTSGQALLSDPSLDADYEDDVEDDSPDEYDGSYSDEEVRRYACDR